MEATCWFSLDGKCFFPFHYMNGVFYDCIKLKAKHKWCSLTRDFKGFWKYCSEEGECLPRTTSGGILGPPLSFSAILTRF